MRVPSILILIMALSLPPGAMAQSAAATSTTTRTTAARPAATRPAAQTPPRPARTPTPAQAAQHQRMRDCNAEARRRSLTGTSRKEFMRPCLRGNMPAATGNAAAPAPRQ